MIRSGFLLQSEFFYTSRMYYWILQLLLLTGVNVYSFQLTDNVIIEVQEPHSECRQKVFVWCSQNIYEAKVRGVILEIPCLNDLHLSHHFYFSLSCEASVIRVFALCLAKWPETDLPNHSPWVPLPLPIQKKYYQTAGAERWGETF